MPSVRPVFTRTFWFDTLERAVKTAAQSVIVVWGLSDAGPGNVNALDLDWGVGLGAAAAGAILSVLFSLVSAPIGDNGTASIVGAPPGPVATES